MFKSKSARRYWVYLIIILSLTTLTSCSAQEKNAFKPVEDYLKKMGAREVKAGMFVTRPDFPDHAYLSVVATWNFANSKGEPQKESLGYLLKKEGESWRMERNVPFTEDRAKAREFIEGKK